MSMESTHAAWQEELARVLESPQLVRSEQLRRLLIHLVEAECQGNTDAQTERVIAEAVFQRHEFDPRFDTIVRSQMSRLRRKVEDYYEAEGQANERMIVLERHGYGVSLQSRMAPGSPEASGSPPEPLSAALSAVSAPSRTPVRGWWLAFAVGAAVAGFLMLLIGLFSPRLSSLSAIQAAAASRGESGTGRMLQSHPLWSPLLAEGGRVRIAVSTPLFFRKGATEIRDHRLNRTEDLPEAARILRQDFSPSWDRWVSFTDLESMASLMQPLAWAQVKEDVQPGRTLLTTDLNRERVIAIGHPRGIPALTEALQNERFGPSEPVVGVVWSGIVDRQATGTEERYFAPPQESVKPGMDEVLPDFALITAKRVSSGGYLLSVFGSRMQTPAFVIRSLTEPGWLFTHLPADQLNGFRTAQFVWRVEYRSGRPVGITPVRSHIVR